MIRYNNLKILNILVEKKEVVIMFDYTDKRIIYIILAVLVVLSIANMSAGEWFVSLGTHSVPPLLAICFHIFETQ